MSDNPSDPMSFLKNLWGNNGFALPGMVTPTLDTEELEKRIKELKTVEGWLRTNLSMLSMTIQNLEMQRSTLSAVQTMSQMYSDAQQGTSSAPAGGGDSSAFAQAAMWPWQMMQQMQESMQQAGETASAAAAAAAAGQAPAPAAASAGATESAAQAGASSRRKKTS
jgi:hypothetical protein